MSLPGQLSLPLRFTNFVGALTEVCRRPLRKKAALPAYGEPFPWKHGIAVRLTQNLRARRYLLRLQPDGEARVIVPSRGSRGEALRFLEKNELWLQRRHDVWRVRGQPWTEGRRFLLRGEEVVLQIEECRGRILLRFGEQVLAVGSESDFQSAVNRRLREIAAVELVARTRELAAVHGVEIRRVYVRAQRTRWGSCSARGTISLNCKLIQAPRFVQDYLILHELMHRREMNHSKRFWKLVAAACPDYQAAERWLKSARLDELG